MKYLIYAITLLLALSLGATNLQADNIFPAADMYTDPEHGGPHSPEQIWVTNYSPSGNFQHLMMKFDLDAYMGHTVDDAILHIYRFFGCPSGGVTGTIMYNITVDWDEETWPENVHIGHGDTEYGWYNFSVNGWQSIDISFIVQSWLNGDIDNFGFVLEATPGSKFSKFYSREANETLRPYLEISTTTAIEDNNTPVPSDFSLSTYPNPFNASTTIEYSIPNSAEVTVEIYNLLGQNVATLVNSYQEAGYHSLTWHGDGNPTGVYFLKIVTEDFNRTNKLLMLK